MALTTRLNMCALPTPGISRKDVTRPIWPSSPIDNAATLSRLTVAGSNRRFSIFKVGVQGPYYNPQGNRGTIEGLGGA